MPTAPPSTPRPVPRLRRSIACLVALSIVATLFTAFTSGSANAAAANNFWFRNGKNQEVFGPNSTVMIDGVLRYDDQCRYDSAIKDFFYPATDVYVVPTGSAGTSNGKLTDINGEAPNTIVGVGDGSFLDEIIGFTSPAGSIPAGVYDLVFDTCQDGFFTDGDDVFPRAITVEMPDVVPPVSPSIQALKERARENYVEWLQFHTLFQVVLNIEKAKEVAACLLAPHPICLMKVLAVIYDEGHIGNRQGGTITTLAADLVLNVAKGHGAIWKDPADPDFQRLPVLDRPDDGDLPSTGQELADAFAGLLPALADEAALSDGLLHALERYQGAQQAGDGEWALVHARAAADLSAVLADHLAGSDAITELRDTIAGDADLSAALAEGAAFANRVRTKGFDPVETRALRNQGFSTTDIIELESSFVRDGFLPSYSATDLVDALEDLTGVRTDMVTALDASAAGWDALATSLEGADHASPAADAGGPYAGATGADLTLDGSASAAAPGQQLTGFEWDLDGDGEFDDATGATPTHVVGAESTLVSLRVTDHSGRQAVAHAVVTATVGDLPPVVTSSQPATASSVVVGDEVTFSVDATDSEGADLSHAWALDGEPVVESTSSLAWTPDAADVGTHTVTLTISDGASRGTLVAWRITVTPADADGDGWTAGADCDDARADRSPGNVERLGNDLDDDCNPSTPDAPPGGLTGSLWAWGKGEGVGISTFTDQRSPVPVPALTDVVQVASTRATGFAVLGSGQVHSWGQAHTGMLGDGTADTRTTPGAVSSADGFGVLSNIVQVEADGSHVVAMDQDGHVVAWGNNNNGQSGDGSVVAFNDRPVEVITADGSRLAGVRAVEAGISESYALLEDGSLASWGVARCRGQAPHPISRTAAAVPLFGTDIVQVVAGQNMVLARKGDGSVWACAGDDELMDRGTRGLTDSQRATPAPMRSFGPGSDVVDVSSGGEGAVALKADGSVWLWGTNAGGVLNPLGVPAYTVVPAPTKVPLPPGPPVVDVEMDSTCHGLAVRADGSVLSWGCNTNGAAGIGSTADPAPGIHVLDLGTNAAHAAAASAWNGYVLVRPIDDPAIVRPAPWISVSAQDATIDEATGGAVEITLSEAAPADVEVSWAISDGAPATATVAAGETSVSIPVSVEDDTVDEEDEELAFHVLSVSHGMDIARRTGVVTVVDDDDAPTVSVEQTVVDEGDNALTDVEVTVRLSQASGKDVEVLWATEDGTATSPTEFGAASGHVLIPAGSTTATFHLAAVGDLVMEPHKELFVELTEPVNATIGTGRATVTLLDDEAIVLRASGSTVTEGDDGTTDAVFTVSATAGPAGTTVTVPWSIASGTATVGDDVEAANATLSFDTSTTTGSVTATVIGDTTTEATEVFRLVLGDAVASDGRPVVLADSATGAIVDDDAVADPDPEPEPEPDPEPEPVFEFDGFFQPIDNLPAVNTVQAGRAIPVKFSLGGDHGLDIFETGHPAHRAVPCDSTASSDVIEQTVAPGTSELTYDAATGQYQYVWKTEKAWKGQCRELLVRFTDGTGASATFRFR